MTDLLLSAINIVISIFLMMAVGVIGARKGIFGPDARKLLSFLIVKLALPCMILSQVTTAYTRETLLEGAYGLIIPFLSMAAVQLIALLLIKVLKIAKGRRGIFAAMTVCSNSVFIGVPIATALFGDGILPHTLLYYIANTVFFWTVSVPYMRSDIQGTKLRLSKDFFRSLFSVSLTTFLVSVAIVLIGFRLPKAVLDACQYMGGIVTPLSMIFIGTILAGIKREEIKLDRSIFAMLAGRFVLSPALVVALSLVFTVPLITRNAIIVQAAMPVMTQVSIMADGFGGDAKYATLGTVVSTVLSLFMIPLIAMLLPLL